MSGASLIGGVRHHPLAAFFVLAYACSWWSWPLYLAGLSPSPVIGVGPCVAAVIVLALTCGRAGVGALLRRMIRWRVGPGWYAAALLLPVAMSTAAAAANLLLGAAAPSPARFGTWPALFGTFVLLLLVPGIGGTWEEPGWRGYAVPELQAHRSALAASLIVGALWAPWHLPLMLSGLVPWSDTLLIVAIAVVYTWLLNSAGGSVLMTMLFHAMNNTVGWWHGMFVGADATRYSWLLAGLWCLAALVVVIATGPARLSWRERVPSVRQPRLDEATRVAAALLEHEGAGARADGGMGVAPDTMAATGARNGAAPRR